MTIRTLTPPDPKNRDTFEQLAWEFTTDLGLWAQEVTVLGQQVEADKEEVEALKDTTASLKNEAQAAVSDCQAEAINCQNQAVLCQTWTNDAEASANMAESYANSIILSPLNATSSTQQSISAGEKIFLTQPDKAFLPGHWIVCISRVSPTNWIKGYIETYDDSTGAMTMMSLQTNGNGSYDDWAICQTTPAPASSYSTVSVKGLYMSLTF